MVLLGTTTRERSGESDINSKKSAQLTCETQSKIIDFSVLQS